MKVSKGQVPALQTLLVDLCLDRVDLVNMGSNSRADILLKKRKEQETMTEFEKLLEGLKPEQQDVIKGHIETVIKAATDTQEENITALKNEVALAKSAKPFEKPAENAQDEILKGATPELKAYIEKMRGDVDGFIAREQEVLAKSRFETVKALPCEEEALKEVLKSASPAVFEVLQKAAKAVEESLLVAKGKEGEGTFVAGSNNAYGKIEKAARAKMLETTGLTFEKAFTMACQDMPEVYAEYAKEAK